MKEGSTVLLYNILNYINKEFFPNLFVDWVCCLYEKMTYARSTLIDVLIPQRFISIYTTYD